MRTLCAIALVTLTGCMSTCSQGGYDGGAEVSAAFLHGDSESSSTDDVGFVIDIKEKSPVMPGLTRASVVYAIEITNYTAEPVRLVRIRLQSQGSNAAQLVPQTSKKFNKLLAPREKTQLEMIGDFEVTDSNIGLDAPMVLRATVEFEQGETKRKAFFTRRIGRGSISLSGPRRN